MKRCLPLLDRVHSLEDSFNLLEYLSKKKLNFSVDFMLGLPYSEKLERNVIGELAQILNYNPSHISLYILTTKRKLPS